MRITACMIVKDEEKNIESSLKSLKNQVDEMIVVDTGSADQTVKLAQQWGAEIFHYRWQNDFAAARNFALEKAKGDWIIFLDADESLVLAGNESLKTLLTGVAPVFEAVLTKLVNVDSDNKNTVLDFFYTVRIFRNKKELLYKGAIHEQLHHRDQRNLSLCKMNDGRISICHTGYSAARIKQKCERDIRLLLKQFDSGDRSVRNYYHLAESYVTLEQYDKALPYLRQVRTQLSKGRTYKSRYYQMFLVTLQNCQLYGSDEYRSVLKEAIDACPRLPDFHAEYAQLLYLSQHYQEAWSEIDLALCLYADGEDMEPSFFGPMLEHAKKLKKRLEEEHVNKSERDDRNHLLAKKLAGQARENLAADLRDLFCCLLRFSQPEQMDASAALLPEAMRRILDAYISKSTIDCKDMDLYNTLRSYIEERVEEKVLQRYLDLAEKSGG